MNRLLILCALLAISHASAAQFKFGTQTLTVPDGFEVELVAGPPLVNRPINMSFDEQGRLYVTDSAGMSDKAQKQLETKPHRVVRLDAANAKGVFEKSVVFADKMMFPEGCLWYGRSLLVSAPPQIWKLTDTDGDGVADKREIWHDGKTLTGCANDLHGPYLGRDGWIYWCKGAFAEQTITLPNGKPFASKAAHIFRARPDGTNVEPVLTGGMDNPVGLAFNSVGERFLSCTFFQHPAGGKRDGLIHAIYGGVYGKVHDVLNGHVMTGDVMPVLTNWGAAAPCGMMCYDSNIFGDGYHDNLFTCSFNLHKVIRTILDQDRETYTTRDSDFLSSDSPDFHPTDVLEDADGSVLVADTGGWYKICCPTSQLAKPDVLGAIYRVKKKDAVALDDPRGLKIEWKKLKDEECAKYLGDERVFVRRRAIETLGDRASDPTAWALMDVADKSTNSEARRNALWALARLYEVIPTFKLHAEWMLDKDPTVASVAAHITSLQAAANREKLQMLAQRLLNQHRPGPFDDDVTAARQAFEALGRANVQLDYLVLPQFLWKYDNQCTDSGTPIDPRIRALEHAFIFAEISSNHGENARKQLTSADVHCVRAAMVVLDQLTGSDLKPEEIIPFLERPEPELNRTANWVVGHHPEWGDAVVDYLTKKLAAPNEKGVDQGQLVRQLSTFAKTPKVQELLARTVSAPSNPDAQRIALRAMAGADVKETPDAWINCLTKVIPSLKGALLDDGIDAVRAYKRPKNFNQLGKVEPIELAGTLYDVTRSDAYPPLTRLNAMLAIHATSSGFQCDILPDLFEFFIHALEPTNPSAERNAACAGLVKIDLVAPHKKRLAKAINDFVGPMEIRQLLPIFERNTTDEIGLLLLDALKSSNYSKSLRPEIVRPVFAKYSKAVQDAAAVWLAELSPNAAAQAAHLDELLKKLPPGDVQRGHVVFHSAKNACSTCHATGYLGGTLGPDLTSIGKTRTERDLLEAIVYPSASFVRSYEPFAVKTTSGERFNGILKKDGADEVVLAIDPKTEKHIRRADIAKIEPGTVSVMPDGFETLIPAQDLADLIAFLRASK